MSSIVGPSLDSVLPKTILPMEVIKVSRYTSPIMSSFTTQVELTLERPGFDTIPMDIGPTGIPWSTHIADIFPFEQAFLGNYPTH